MKSTMISKTKNYFIIRNSRERVRLNDPHLFVCVLTQMLINANRFYYRKFKRRFKKRFIAEPFELIRFFAKYPLRKPPPLKKTPYIYLLERYRPMVIGSVYIWPFFDGFDDKIMTSVLNIRGKTNKK